MYGGYACEVEAIGGAGVAGGRGTVRDWGVGTSELPLVGRNFRAGFVLPFCGGGVTDVDQCLMLSIYAA